MRGFDDVSFEWAGRTFKIPAHKVLGAIARVEDVITLSELQRYGEKNGTPLAKIAMAYGSLLRYAGASVSDVEIYEGLFGQGKNVNPNSAVSSVITLISMMIPPAAMAAAKTATEKQGQSLGNALPAATKKKNK